MRRFVLLNLLSWWCLALPAAPAIQVHDAWIRLLPGDLPLAGYCTLVNGTDHRLRLTGAASPAFRQVMLHQSIHRHGTSRMQAVHGIDIPPGGELRIRPGGYHLMLMGRRRALHPGDRVRVELRFRNSAPLRIPFEVRSATE